MSSSFAALRYCLHGIRASLGQRRQLLEIRLNYLTRLVSPSPATGLPHQLLQESPSTPMAHALFAFPLRQLGDPFFCESHVVRLLASLNLHAAARDVLALKITSFVIHLAAGHYDSNHFRVVAEVDYIQIYWIDRLPGLYLVPITQRPNVPYDVGYLRNPLDGLDDYAATVDETVILGSEDMTTGTSGNEDPTTKGASKSAIERLKKEKFVALGDELGDCSVCYEELCGEKEVIRMPCGYPYHDSCILQWLNKRNSCPLCRRQVDD